MKISPNEIVSSEEIGILNKKPVKLAKTRGGFVIALGTPRGKSHEEALAVGSHVAIVKYNVEQKFPEFQPAMMKSENGSEQVVVDKHSHFLTDDLRKAGYDIYSIQKGPLVNFHITKLDMSVALVKGHVNADELSISDLKIEKQFVRPMAAATSEKAHACGARKVKVNAK